MNLRQSSPRTFQYCQPMFIGVLFLLQSLKWFTWCAGAGLLVAPTTRQLLTTILINYLFGFWCIATVCRCLIVQFSNEFGILQKEFVKKLGEDKNNERVVIFLFYPFYCEWSHGALLKVAWWLWPTASLQHIIQTNYKITQT